jgi:hypothetical protein
MMEIQGSTNAFWLWWALTLVAAIWQIWRAWQRPRELLGFATVASVLWLYIYCYLPYHLISEQKLAFPAKIWNLAQFTALASLLSLLVGWHWKVDSARRSPRPAPEETFDMDRLWWCGLGALAIGLAGFYSFVRSGREFAETSAYWYLLFNTCYPGMALCVVVMTLSPRHRSVLHWGTLALLASLIVLPNLLGARRGPTFVVIIALFFSFAAIRRKPVHPVILLSVLCAAGLLMLLLVTSRRVTYSAGGTWTEFLHTVTAEEVLQDRAKRTGDNEYFNHCQMLEANLRTGLYQYGTAHLAVLMNWVPRRFWPDKPQRGLGFLPEALREIERDDSSNLGTGGAWGAVADSFNNYWYYFPVFWLGIGWLTGAAFLRGQVGGSMPWKLYNVGILCAAHWFIAQNLSEAFVPFMIFQGTFFIAFKYARVRAARKPKRPQPAPRSVPAPQPSGSGADVSPASEPTGSGAGVSPATEASRLRDVPHGRGGRSGRRDAHPTTSPRDARHINRRASALPPGESPRP